MTNWMMGVLSFLLVIIIMLLALPFASPNRAAPAWEYRIEDVPDLQFLPTMERIGNSGWELVFARRAIGEGKESNYEMIFKRPK